MQYYYSNMFLTSSFTARLLYPRLALAIWWTSAEARFERFPASIRTYVKLARIPTDGKGLWSALEMTSLYWIPGCDPASRYDLVVPIPGKRQWTFLLSTTFMKPLEN
jgi:hypothetical protein